MIPARKLFAALTLGALGALFALSASPILAGCDSRFPTCQTNADCQQRDGGGKLGNVCFNLRCLECHYDSDCAVGQVCNGVGTCRTIAERPEAEGDGGEPGWEPATWDECAKGCKEQPCLDDCDRRFHSK